jgi:NADPH:quinone reductase-like Zn-dependent oxidoreductase
MPGPSVGNSAACSPNMSFFPNRVPSPFPFEEAAMPPCAGLTAWNALYGGAPAKPGQTVLILGTGGVSAFALQYAKTGGARAIVSSRSDSKMERMEALGADLTINTSNIPDWDKEVIGLTHGRGVDHMVENGGAGTLSRSLKASGSAEPSP